jgi:predicted transcriptional regulator
LARDADSPTSARLVYLALASRADKQHNAWPSLETIARDSGLGIATVKRALSWLRETGWVTWERRSSATGRKSNLYTLRHTQQLTSEPLGSQQLMDEPLGATQQLKNGRPNSSLVSQEQLKELKEPRARESCPTNRVDETSPAYAAHLWSMR